MRVGHSDLCPLPQFQWTRQALWKSTRCRASGLASATATQTATTTTAATDGCPAQTLPGNRSEHASCLLGHHVYLFGGNHRYVPLKDMWRLDLENGQWESIGFKDSKMPHLQGHTMVSYRSQVFIFGGLFGEYPDDIPLWIYSPDLNHVRKYTREPLLPCPIGRRDHTAVVYKNFMFICGGFVTSAGSSDELWAFNLEEEEWLCLPPHKGGKRHGHVSVVHRHAMWVHGGASKMESLSDLWVYHLELQTWTKIKASGKSPSLSNHTAHVVDDSIVIVGGSNKSTPYSNVWMYGICTNTWRKVDVDDSHLFDALFLHTSVLIDPKSILDNTKDKSSQSTPHLKSHLVETVTHSGRPWTSPRPESDSSHCSPPYSTSPDVNVLTVHSEDSHYIPFTDKNNNSEENLFCRPDNIEMKTFNCYSVKYCDEFYKSSDDSSHLQSSNVKNLKLHPASLEHCQDELPLLKRFCSIESGVDRGETNTVLTLSDEHVYESFPRSDLSGKNVDRLFNESNVDSTDVNNPQFRPKSVNLEESKVVIALSDDHVNSQVASHDKENKCSLMIDNPAFLPVISSSTGSFKVGTSENVSSTGDVNNREGVPKSNDSDPLVKIQPFPNVSINDDLPRPLTKYGFSESHHLSEHSNVQNSVLPCESSITSTNEEQKRDNFFNEFDCYEWKNFQSLNDLIVEDIESCNNESGVLTDLTIASPSTFVKSSSYKDISVCGSSFDRGESLHTSNPFYVDSPRIHSNSCNSLTVIFNGNESTSQSLSSMIEARNRKNLCLTTTEKPGKFVKHQSRFPHRNGFWLERQRPSSQFRSQKKMITSSKSVATQTMGSQTSLTSNDKPHKTVQGVVDRGQNSAKKDFSTLPPDSAVPACNRRMSISSDCKYLLLVFGGHMGSPVLTNSALDIWKCKIF